jgi:hypothetical protein
VTNVVYSFAHAKCHVTCDNRPVEGFGACVTAFCVAPPYDNFNFLASPLRIRVEMAFGMMQAKWGILQRPLQCKMVNAKDTAQAIARLHNFVIDERLLQRGELDTIDRNSPGYMPSIPHDENGNPIDIKAVFSGLHHRGYSQLRGEKMSERVQALGLERPVSNCLNQNNLKQKHCV